MNRFKGLMLVSLLAGSVAFAQNPGPRWSVLSGRTLGSGSAIHAEGGFPGLNVSYLTAASPTMDIGAKFGFDYALLNDVSNFVGEVDIRGQFVARLALLDTGKVNFGLEFQPGVVVEFLTGGPYLGLILPVSGKLGFPITDVVMLNAAVDIPFFLRFSGGQAALALLFGGGVEYLLEPNLALTFNLRFGPVMWFSNNGFGGVTDFGMNALIGIAYKM